MFLILVWGIIYWRACAESDPMAYLQLYRDGPGYEELLYYLCHVLMAGRFRLFLSYVGFVLLGDVLATLPHFLG